MDGRILDAVERLHQKTGTSLKPIGTPLDRRNHRCEKIGRLVLHAITASERSNSSSEPRENLRQQQLAPISTQPLNDIDEIEAYGRGPR